jgi:uncharacterized iron-regulated membrane protein
VAPNTSAGLVSRKLAKAKPKLFAAHRWLALFAGMFLILQGTTGTIIAFRQELDRTVHHAAMKVLPAVAQPPLSEVIRAAQAALVGERVSRVDYPDAKDDAYIARLSGKFDAIATVDQRGVVTRAANVWFWPVEAAYLIHQSLMGGLLGQTAVGLVGIALIILALSGFLYWWPTHGRIGQAFERTIHVKLARGRAARELHRALAITYSFYLLLSAITGLMMAWSIWTLPAVGAVFPVMRQEPKFVRKLCAAPRPIDASIAAARAIMPGATIKSVRFTTDQVVAIYFRSRVTYPARIVDRVWVDMCNADVIAAETKSGSGDAIFNWLQPIHSGEWLGLLGRVLTLSAAIALMTTGVSGYVLWLGRALKQRRVERHSP